MRVLNNQIHTKLEQLHHLSDRDTANMFKHLAKGIFKKLQPEDMQTTYMAIGKEDGMAMYQQVLDQGCKHIVEYGTSFGISTLYLAAAAAQTGGKVITSELIPSKAAVAQQNFKDAGAAHLIEVRVGDALETLSTLDQPVDYFFLDGWAEINIPLLKALEAQFTDGALVRLDNANFPSSKGTKRYLRSHSQFDILQDKRGNRTFEAIYRWG